MSLRFNHASLCLWCFQQQCQIKQRLFDCSQLLRSMAIGQDRYRRHYWLLPRCGGIFVEGMESCEGVPTPPVRW